jgi:hypothetical protein
MESSTRALINMARIHGTTEQKLGRRQSDQKHPGLPPQHAYRQRIPLRFKLQHCVKLTELGLRPVAQLPVVPLRC